MLKIGHIELFVTNIKAAQIFYQDVLGFELVADQGEFVWFKCGTVEILLRSGNQHETGKSYQDASSAIVLYTDNLAETIKSFESCGLIFNGNDGSENCPTFTDPDGHWFQLASP